MEVLSFRLCQTVKEKHIFFYLGNNHCYNCCNRCRAEHVLYPDTTCIKVCKVQDYGGCVNEEQANGSREAGGGQGDAISVREQVEWDEQETERLRLIISFIYVSVCKEKTQHMLSFHYQLF